MRGLPDEVEEPAFRARANAIDAPISIYEVHLGSWKRNPETISGLTYEELAKRAGGIRQRHGLYPYRVFACF